MKVMVASGILSMRCAATASPGYRCPGAVPPANTMCGDRGMNQDMETRRGGDKESLLLAAISLSPCLRVSPSSQKSAETPERRPAPPRCSDIGFIVKHSPRAVDPETALPSEPYAPTQGGWPREIPQFRARPTMKPQRIRSFVQLLKSRTSRVGTAHRKVFSCRQAVWFRCWLAS